MTQPFDASTAELRGDAFAIDEKLLTNPAIGGAAFSTSDAGVLAYRIGEQSVEQLAEWTRDGKLVQTGGDRGDYRDLALSHDSTRLMLHRHDDAAGGGGLWLIDRTRNTTSRFTFSASHDVSAHWSPKGDQVAFVSDRDGGVANIYRKNASGAGSDELLLKTDEQKSLTDWSRDGRYLVYTSTSPKTGIDIWVLPMQGDGTSTGKPITFLQTGNAEGIARLSPDSRWMAYVSNETGRNEVYVQPFPASGGKWQISTNGGTQPRWRGDGEELYYVGPGSRPQHLTMMAVSITATGNTLRAGVPTPVFSTMFSGLLTIGRNINESVITQSYAVSGDGKRFFCALVVPDAAPPAINVIVNWPAAFKK